MSDNKCVSLIIAVCALIIVLMLPLKNSIYSDDVAFSQSVRHFLQTGDLKVSEYTAASSFSHILWGSLFAKALGFSFSSLNISVIVLLPMLIIGFYFLLRELNQSSARSFIFTLFFLAVPWVIFLTYTFMSDIPFLTLEIYTLLFFIKFLKNKSRKHLAICLVLGSLAFLMRQLGLALILGAFIGFFSLNKLSSHAIKKYALPLLIPIVVIILYGFWLSIPGNKTIPQYVLEGQTKEALQNFIPFSGIPTTNRVANIALIVHRTFNYANQALGLLFPLIVVIVFSNTRSIKTFIKKNFLIIFFSTAIVSVIYLLDVVNFRNQYFAGFPLLIYEYESLFPIPWANAWKYFVLLSLPFWTTLIAKTMLRDIRTGNTVQIYLLATFFAILFMTVITFYSWDRYLLPLLPFVFIYLAGATKFQKLNTRISILVVSLLILDALQITKLRYDEAGTIYKIGNQLVSQGVEPSTIDLNRDQGWDIWFYYEDGIQKQIEDVGGDKEKIDFQLFPLPKKNVKYGIYTDRMIKYQNLYIDYSKATIIPFKSLFISSKLTFINY